MPKSHHDPKQRPIRCAACACVSIVLFSLMSVATIIMTSISIHQSGLHSNSRTYKISGNLQSTPFGQQLDGNNAPLLMKLPNNLLAGGFVDQTYCASAVDASAHQIMITAGTLATRFDGGFTTLTFDGNSGSSVCYRAVSATHIHILSPPGVGFTLS